VSSEHAGTVQAADDLGEARRTRLTHREHRIVAAAFEDAERRSNP
jgi:hypothetical protein